MLALRSAPGTLTGATCLSSKGELTTMKRKVFFQFTAPSNIVMIALMIVPLGLAVWFGLN